jgi:hypothetical protein
MRMRRKKKRKKIGISLALLLIALSSAPILGQKKKAAPATYGVVAGSVFRESGYSLPDAQITLLQDPQAGSSPAKAKKLESVSDARGEFSFHVPPAPMRYIVRVKARGYESQEKPVDFQGEERIDLTFQMEPESKK